MLLSWVGNCHPSTGIPWQVPPASPPTAALPCLWLCPFSRPVCVCSPALLGERVGVLDQHQPSRPLSNDWRTVRAWGKEPQGRDKANSSSPGAADS